DHGWCDDAWTVEAPLALDHRAGDIDAVHYHRHAGAARDDDHWLVVGRGRRGGGERQADGESSGLGHVAWAHRVPEDNRMVRQSKAGRLTARTAGKGNSRTALIG